MNTIKTAAVVALLLAVLYGVYVVLNKPQTAPLDNQAWNQPAGQPMQIEAGTPVPQGEAAPQSPAASHGQSPFDAARPSRPPALAQPPGEADQALSDPAGQSADPHVHPLPGETNLVSATQDITAIDGFDPAASAASGTNNGVELAETDAFEQAWETANSLLQESKFADALRKLSVYYGDPGLTASQHQRLVDMLDPLAGHVIYSPEHLLERAYIVRRGDTLEIVAQQYEVPWQLLKNINGVRDPQVLVPGSELKVVRGPFRAEVKLQDGNRGELVLFLHDMYAGRFEVNIGNDPAPFDGKYTIRDKREGRDYYSVDGGSYAATHPANPFGRHWIDLGSEVSIHGSPVSGNSEGRGCISLTPMDAEDVYAILSVGSQVVISR